MNKTILSLGIVGAIAIATASTTSFFSYVSSHNSPAIAQTETTQNSSFNYQDYAEVLQTYVDETGLVDYIGLQKNREQLDRFNQSLGAVSPQTYASWDEPTQIAFLINAYNSFTLQSIIDREPLVDSIRDISGVWNRRKFNLAGEEKTLDNIEHDILRKEFNKPEIHVALVCAAISCPPLLNEPYLPEQLDAQLNNRAAKFVENGKGFQLDTEANRVYLSSIFKWYGKDFIENYGVENKFQGNKQQRAVINYLSSQLSDRNLQFIEKNDYRVKYLDYDWSLNQQ